MADRVHLGVWWKTSFPISLPGNERFCFKKIRAALGMFRNLTIVSGTQYNENYSSCGGREATVVEQGLQSEI